MGSLNGILCAMLSAACFGMLAVFGKLAYLKGFEATEILQYRFGIGALMLLVWFSATNRSVLRAKPKTILKAVFLGVVLYPVQSLSFMTSLKYIPAATTSLILYFYPVAVTLLSALIYKTRLDKIVAISLMLLVAGCGLVFFDAFLRDISRTGLMLASLSMLIFSTYLICLEWLLRGENPITISFYCVLAAAVVWTIVSPPVRFMALDMEAKALTLALGLIPTALAVTLLYRSVDLIGSASASICSTLEPITTVLASALLLNEAVVPIQIAGMVLILAGIVLPNAQMLRLKRS